ncbi:acetoin dehydrogenase [Gammaproteobacteria bacterium 45_16_T64]|nr:acetoin dehydrogenase [Gammaproteobacteria bacterium 45_16_T64]
MKRFEHAVIAITGAASGIGEALAETLAKNKACLALSDISGDALESLRSHCLTLGAEDVIIDTVDVADSASVYQWADRVNSHFGRVNAVINNAGVALSGSVEQTADKDFQWLMDINFWGVVYGSKAFLPYLKQSDWGHIVNVSSLFGLIAIPNQSAYNAAKFAVKGFSESLRMELEIEKSSVNVSCVHPGGVKTNIANSGKIVGMVGKQRSADQMKKEFNDTLARTTPEQAAQIILKGLLDNSPRILVGIDAKIGDLIQRILPTGYQKLIRRAMG